MSQTMLQLVNQVQSELNLAVSTSVAGNTNTDVQQILALMNASGYELLKEHDWQALQVQYRFYTNSLTANATTVNGSYNLTFAAGTDLSNVTSQWQLSGYNIPQDTYVVSANNSTKVVVMSQMATGNGVQSVVCAQTAYDLPFDFETITDRTQWDKSKHWEMLGPEDAQQWQWLKSGYISTGPRVRWRILDNQFQIWPIMNTNEYLGWEYRSKGWARGADGSIKNSFTADSDTTVLDDRIMVLATKLKYFQVKSFDTTALMQDYQRYLTIAKANDKGAPNLSFSPQASRVLIGYANIPDTGYGS